MRRLPKLILYSVYRSIFQECDFRDDISYNYMTYMQHTPNTPVLCLVLLLYASHTYGKFCLNMKYAFSLSGKGEKERKKVIEREKEREGGGCR